MTACADGESPQLIDMQYRGVLPASPGGGACPVECVGARVRPVCASDGRTYPHKCAVRRARRCDPAAAAATLAVVSKGRCKAAASGREGSGRSGAGAAGISCRRERKQALAKSRGGASGQYVPRCKADGTFADAQCHAATGYCWCVTPDGKPISDSSIRDTKVDCRRFSAGGGGGGGASGRSREHSKSKRNDSGKKRRGLSKGPSCSKSEKSQFNHNLVTLFMQEYNRLEQALNITKGPDLLKTREKEVIEWKFNELDADHDGRLKRREIKEMKQVVKNVLEPRVCARRFDRDCDADADRRITRREWSACLGVDINNDNSVGLGGRRGRLPGLPPSAPASGSDHGTSSSPSAGGGRRRPQLAASSLSFLALRGRGRPRQSFRPSSPAEAGLGLHETAPASDRSDHPEDDTPTGCQAARVEALTNLHHNPDGVLFVPECIKATDKYARTQCHDSGYCWCVDELTGNPLQGPPATQKPEMPDCDNFKIHKFKGCPYSVRRAFLESLLDQLSLEMVNETSAPRPGGTGTGGAPAFLPEHSLEERAVRWKLTTLDTNNNRVLERRELKQFKKEIRRRKKLRKCSRNFLRYCDEDDDKKISMEEWIDCTGLNDVSKPSNGKRNGENPFTKYLKPYDKPV